MKEIKVGTGTVFSAPSNAASVEVRHEWDNELLVSYTLSGGETSYTYTPDSIGIHKVIWKDSGDAEISKEFYSAIVQVVSSSEFFNAKPELEDYDEQFAEWERIARFTIENYTNQRFGPYLDKTMTIQGDDGNSLVLPLRVLSLTTIVDNYGEDITELVMVGPNNDEIVQYRPGFRGPGWEYDTKRDISWNSYELFSHRKDFTITANWGWEYVPSEVSQAAMLIIEDALGDGEAFALRGQGVQEAQLGDFRIKLDGDKWGTTGNARADSLLGRFINYGIELI